MVSKKKSKISPTQRSLKWLRAEGMHAAVVEKWNPFVGIRQDLFGWIDIVAVGGVNGFTGVQTTTHKHLEERIAKAAGNKALAAWLRAGGHLVVHGWKKVKNRWQLFSRYLNLMDIEKSQSSVK